MISEKQQIANEKNAQLGGVKTQEGKDIVKFNAQTHCIFRETITEYEKGDYSDIIERLISELKPLGIIEEILVERIATCYIKLYRLAKAENEHIKTSIHPEEFELTFPAENGYSPKVNSKAVEGLVNIYARYETTIENRMYRALHELDRVQKIKDRRE
jgi:hypothetical protein